MRHVTHKYVDKKLIFRIRMFFVIFIVLLGIIVFEALEGQGDILYTFISFLIGTVVGFVAGRMIAIKWHDDANKIVGSVDRLGVLFIILYLFFSLGRHAILENLFHGTELTLLSLSIVSGIMFGKVMSAMHSIRKILRHKKLLP